MKVPLTNGRYAQVDPEDYEKVMQYRWGVKLMHGKPYARSTTNPRVWLHRLVMSSSPKEKRDVDHKNHDTLDNRRSNLRIVTRVQNQQNRISARIDSRTQIRGVTKRKTGMYMAYANLRGRRYYFGANHPTLESAEVAAIAGRQKLMTHSDQDMLK